MNNFFSKLTLLSVGAVLSFAAIDANLVQAATLTQTITSPFEFEGSSVYLDYRATGNFTQFDPRLGTLTGVSLSVSDGTGTITVSCPSFTEKLGLKPRPSRTASFSRNCAIIYMVEIPTVAACLDSLNRKVS